MYLSFPIENNVERIHSFIHSTLWYKYNSLKGKRLQNWSALLLFHLCYFLEIQLNQN